MVSVEDLRDAVERAKEMLGDCGIDVDVTAEQLWEWLETDLPAPDVELGSVALNPLFIIHQLVEIDELLKIGLEITKDVRLRNLDEVGDAHLKAAKIELLVGKTIGATENLKDRIKSMEKWCLDKTLSEKRKAEFEQLLAEANSHLERLTVRSG